MSKMNLAVFWTICVLNTCIMLDKGLSLGTTCYEDVKAKHHETGQCEGFLFQPVCLVCNVSLFMTEVSWYVNNVRLTQDEFNLREEHAGGTKVNMCHSEKYSLRLESPSTENHEAVYFCERRGHVVTEFKLKLQAQTNLFINSTNIFNGKILVTKKESNNNLQCVIEEAVPPFMLAWSLNGFVVARKAFNNTEEIKADIYLDISHSLRENSIPSNSELTCSCKGRYIPSDNVTLHVFLVDFTENNSNSTVVASATLVASATPLVNWSLVLAASLFVLVVATFVIIKGIKTFCSTRRESPAQLNLSTTENATADPTYEKYNYITETKYNYISETVNQTGCKTEIKKNVPGAKGEYDRNISTKSKKYVPVVELKYDRNITTKDKNYVPVVEMKYERNIGENCSREESQ